MERRLSQRTNHLSPEGELSFQRREVGEEAIVLKQSCKVHAARVARHSLRSPRPTASPLQQTHTHSCGREIEECVRTKDTLLYLERWPSSRASLSMAAPRLSVRCLCWTSSRGSASRLAVASLASSAKRLRCAARVRAYP